MIALPGGAVLEPFVDVEDIADMAVVALAAMFDSVLDGRNSHLGRGVQEALGRDPREFGAFPASAVADGAWSPATQAAR